MTRNSFSLLRLQVFMMIYLLTLIRENQSFSKVFPAKEKH